MDVGIGLPATIPGAQPGVVLDWAKRADAGPFSSLGIIDRVVYPNYEPLVALAAAAGVTQRVRLMTTVLLAPMRPAGILAKQAATLDVLSGGRLTLGLGVGGRDDDFHGAPAPFEGRAERFEEQIQVMRRVWSGRPPYDGVPPIGPQPVRQGGPEVLIGGYVPPAIRRAGRLGDGFIAGGVDPDTSRQFYAVAEEAWKEAGRRGKPRFVCSFYWALGPDAAERGGAYIRDYYDYMGPAADQMAQSIPTTPDAVRAALQAYADAGADEVVAWPCIAEIDQVDRLAQLVG